MMIDRFMKQGNFVSEQQPFLDDTYRKFVDHTLLLARKAVVFEVSNVADYFISINKSKATELSFPNLAPTYPVIWFEWYRKWAILVESFYSQEIQDKTIEKIDEHGKVLISESKWVSRLAIIREVRVGENSVIFPSTEMFQQWVDEDGIFKLGEEIYLNGNIHGDRETREEERKFLNDCIPVANLALSFCHCKNVNIESHEASMKLQRARKRKGRAPLVRYHVLEIKPMVKVLKEEGLSEKTGIKQALHICRGHFKDYSQGNGLFGKYKGLYWWDMQARGNTKEGIVLKDYKVTTGVKEVN